MHAYNAIQNSLDYIETHLKEDINVEIIAGEAGLSVYYFQHLFSRLIKKPLNEYIKLRRLAKASEALKNKDVRIIDVAFEYGFSDHANFTRAFRDIYGITPEEYRSSPVILNHFIKPDLSLKYEDTEENVPLIADGIVIEIIRKKLDEPLYFMGVEGKVPCGEYIVCCLETKNFEELIESAIFKAYSFMEKWLKKHSLICGGFTAEMYYSVQTEPCRMEIWIPLKEQSWEKKSKEKMWDKTDGISEPSMSAVSMYVDSPLFERLCRYIEIEYQGKAVFEYSRCSLQYGWNIKYKKAGRTLCTIYPMRGYFTVLIVITSSGQQEIEMILPVFTEYTQKIYRETKVGMGQRWLMLDVTNESIMEDVKRCIAIRRQSCLKSKGR